MSWIKNWSCDGGKSLSTEYGVGNPSESLCRFFVGLWAFLMLTVFPLYMRNRYEKMGTRKFEFFLAVSIACLLPAALMQLLIWVKYKRDKSPLAVLKGLSGLDLAMLLYMAAVFLSYFMSSYRGTAFRGVRGWYMGLRSQLLFVLIYFLASRSFPWKKVIFAGHFISSGAVFLFGILHRFMIDPLGLYEGIDESYHIWYLSTIGQATWYSSYVCTVLVIGVTAFFLAEKRLWRVLAGLYCMLGFATVVTQNSDSAFAAMALLFFGLFLAACDNADKMERFFETLLLMLFSFKLMGVLQELFPGRAVELGGLSEFLSQSAWTWVLFMAAALLYIGFLLYRQKTGGASELKYGGLLRRAAAAAFLIAVSALVLLIWLNTTGRLDQWFSIKSNNQYLLFDNYWGNSRGFTWKFTVSVFAGFPLYRKLFGVGPDCFSAYNYGDPKLSGRLDHYFGLNETLTNAHNEFLNTVFCLGIVGLAAFLLIFGAAFVRFYRMRQSRPGVLAGLLVVLVYCAHNFFCYQQVCCTPFLFLILGLAENLARGGGVKDKSFTQ